MFRLDDCWCPVLYSSQMILFICKGGDLQQDCPVTIVPSSHHHHHRHHYHHQQDLQQDFPSSPHSSTSRGCERHLRGCCCPANFAWYFVGYETGYLCENLPGTLWIFAWFFVNISLVLSEYYPGSLWIFGCFFNICLVLCEYLPGILCIISWYFVTIFLVLYE